MLAKVKQKYTKLSDDNLIYRKLNRKHSLPKKLEVCTKKFLKRGEEIDSTSSKIAGNYCTLYTKGKQIRLLFCKKIKERLLFLYDADSLIEAYSKSKGFRKFDASDAHIYLNLAIAYWREEHDIKRCIYALMEFIKREPSAKGKSLMEKAEDYAWLFIIYFEGFSLLNKAYLKMGMLKEAAILDRKFADCMYAKEEEKSFFVGHSYLLLEQFNKAISFFKRGVKKEKKNIDKLTNFEKGIIPSSKHLDNLRYGYYWATGMQRWEQGKIGESLKAFQEAREISEKGSPEEKLMVRLLESIHSSKEFENMAFQISLLNKWREEAKPETPPSESDMLQLLFNKVEYVEEYIKEHLAVGKGIILPQTGERKLAYEEEKLRTEPQKYLVFIPYKNKIGTRPLEVSEWTVKKTYLPKSNEFDIFIYTESIFVKDKKKMVRLDMEARMRKLLIMFLKYKDMSIPPIPLYRRAWIASPLRLRDIRVESEVTEHIKVAKSQLETSIYKYVPSFKICKPRNQGYICKGSFNYCVIIDSKDDKKYRLIEAEEPEDY